MAVIVTIASVVFVGMTALLLGFIIIAQKNRKEGEDSSLESMSNQYIFQYNQSLSTIIVKLLWWTQRLSYIIAAKHDEITNISKFDLVSDTSFTREPIECDVTALNRPHNIRFFLGPGLSLEPEAKEFEAIQSLHNQKHLLRYDSDIARKHRLLNRYT